MDRLFKYLDKAIKELYKQDKDILDKQSLNSSVFRIGVYLNDLLKSDLYYNKFYCDYRFKNNNVDYLDLIIHTRSNDQKLVIQLIKDKSEIKKNINKIESITSNDFGEEVYGVLVLLDEDYYNYYILSSKYYNE